MPHANVPQIERIIIYTAEVTDHLFWAASICSFTNIQQHPEWFCVRCGAWKSIWLQNLVVGSELFLTHLDKAATLIDLYTGFHSAEQHWQPQGHTSIRDLGEFKHCRSTLAQRRLSPPLSRSPLFSSLSGRSLSVSALSTHSPSSSSPALCNQPTANGLFFLLQHPHFTCLFSHTRKSGDASQAQRY